MQHDNMAAVSNNHRLNLRLALTTDLKYQFVQNESIVLCIEILGSFIILD